MPPYPTSDKIEEIFADRDLPDIFNTYLVDHVDVSVNGHEFHLGGHHKSKEAFMEDVFHPLLAPMKIETLRLEVNRVIGGGDSAWAAVYSTATAIAKNDKPYRHEFVDLVRFNTDGKIAQIKEFQDTKLIHSLWEEHQSSSTKEQTENRS